MLADLAEKEVSKLLAVVIEMAAQLAAQLGTELLAKSERLVVATARLMAQVAAKRKHPNLF